MKAENRCEELTLSLRYRLGGPALQSNVDMDIDVSLSVLEKYRAKLQNGLFVIPGI